MNVTLPPFDNVRRLHIGNHYMWMHRFGKPPGFCVVVTAKTKFPPDLKLRAEAIVKRYNESEGRLSS